MQPGESLQTEMKKIRDALTDHIASRDPEIYEEPNIRISELGYEEVINTPSNTPLNLSPQTKFNKIKKVENIQDLDGMNLVYINLSNITKEDIAEICNTIGFPKAFFSDLNTTCLAFDFGESNQYIVSELKFRMWKNKVISAWSGLPRRSRKRKFNDTF